MNQSNIYTSPFNPAKFPEELFQRLLTFFHPVEQAIFRLTNNYHFKFISKIEYMDMKIVKYIAEGNHTNMFKTLRLCTIDSIDHQKIEYDYGPIGKYGRLDIIKWLHVSGIDVTDACVGALSGGHLDIIEWYHENGHKFTNDDVHIVLRSNNYDAYEYVGDKYTFNTRDEEFYDSLRIAVSKNYLNSILFVHNTIPKLIIDQNACIGAMISGAAKSGNINVIRYAHGLSHGAILHEFIDCFVMDIKNTLNHTRCIQWLHKKNYKLPRLCLFAASSGNFELLKWAYDNKFSFNQTQVFYASIKADNIKILEWIDLIQEHSIFTPTPDCTYDVRSTFHYASANTIQWIFNRGYLTLNILLLNECVFTNRDYLKVKNIFIQYNEPRVNQSFIYTAARNIFNKYPRDFKIIKLFFEMGYEFESFKQELKLMDASNHVFKYRQTYIDYIDELNKTK